MGGERRGRVRALARLDRAVCCCPGDKPAVEHAGVIVPEVAQQPPEPRRPHRHVLRVRDDVRAVADAEAAERGCEVLGRRKGERERRRRVRQRAGDIGEPGPGNMGSRVALAPALHGIRATVRRAAEEDGGVEHAHSLITERVAELLGADQPGQQWHFGASWASIFRVSLRYGVSTALDGIRGHEHSRTTIHNRPLPSAIMPSRRPSASRHGRPISRFRRFANRRVRRGGPGIPLRTRPRGCPRCCHG